MANVSFLPVREAELVTWSTNFNTKINATPTAYGLTAPQGTAYTTLHTAFVNAYNAANSDSTNSRSATVTKNTAKAALIANARLLAGIVQKYPGTTNTMRSDLGLTVRDTQPTPIPPPSTAPDIDIVSVSGNTVKLRLHDVNGSPSKRGKPAGVSGAAVFSFVGAAAPTDEGAWSFEGNASRTVVDVTFPPGTAPGAKVWFTAFWFNQRKQSGPASAPVGTNIPGGSAMAA
jgi:hypothetical protein